MFLKLQKFRKRSKQIKYYSFPFDIFELLNCRFLLFSSFNISVSTRRSRLIIIASSILASISSQVANINFTSFSLKCGDHGLFHLVHLSPNYSSSQLGKFKFVEKKQQNGHHVQISTTCMSSRNPIRSSLRSSYDEI